MKTKTILINEANKTFATYSPSLAREEVISITQLASYIRRFIAVGYVVKVAKRPNLDGLVSFDEQTQTFNGLPIPDPERKAS